MADEQVKATDEKPNPFEAEVKAENAKRLSNKEYVGLLLSFGNTRGKGSIPIKWEKFDETVPSTVPKTVEQFMEITGIKANAELAELLVVGFNDAQYTAASDPIAEHVNVVWDKDTQSQFRLAVRNYSKATGFSIEESVALIKPGIEKAFANKAKQLVTA